MKIRIGLFWGLVLFASLPWLLAQTAQVVISGENAGSIQMLGGLPPDNLRTRALAYHPQGIGLAISETQPEEGEQIRWLDLATQEKSIWWLDDEQAAYALTFSPDGSHLLFFSGLEVLSLETASEAVETLYTAASSYQAPNALAFNPDGDLIGMGSRDGQVVVLAGNTVQAAWLTADPTLDEVERLQEQVNQVRFIAAGQLISVHESGQIRVWDINTPETPIQAWEGHRRAITDLAISPDGQFLATVGKDHLVKVWGVKDWAEVYTLEANATHIEFSPDGSLLAAGGKSLYVWSMATGEKLYQNYHANRNIAASNLTFSPDGSLIMSSSRQVAVWGLDAGELDLLQLEDDRVAAGAELYQRSACNGCHTEYTSGAPSLYGVAEVADTRVEGLNAHEYLYQAIVDPDAFIVKGFPRGIHPAYYGERMSREEVEMMVEYILTLESDS